MAAGPQSGGSLSVPRWVKTLSAWQERYPRFWITLGNLESRVLAEQLASVRVESPIYIAGLARSGTTILLELLSRHPQLVTHRYRDFPPVLIPWFWNWFLDRASARPLVARERAHGDGIQITPESPEAFEEVIWMAFGHGHDPGASAVLTAKTRDDAFARFYGDHIRKLLLVRNGTRYLCKANYNLTRLGYLLALFSDARFLVPVRDPVRHIASLMKQHERFCREHSRDMALQRHMSRSGHFEFGLDRRPVNSGSSEVTRKILEHWENGDQVEGWALYWQDLYGHVADVLTNEGALRDATLVVDYESLCSNPRPVMEAIVAHCDLPAADMSAAAAERIRHQDYYQPSFTPQELQTIEAITAPVKKRLAALAI